MRTGLYKDTPNSSEFDEKILALNLHSAGKSVSDFLAMKFYLLYYLFIIFPLNIISRANRVPLWKRVKLVAVSRFDDLDTYYKNVFESKLTFFKVEI